MTLKTCDRYENKVFLTVASRFKERQKSLFNLTIASFAPFAIVHLIDNDNKSLDSQTLGQLGVFPSLTILLETCLKLSFSS